MVLDSLNPLERIAFVLHDMFAVPFAEIARIVDRSTAAARQLASRARRRVRLEENVPDADLETQRRVVAAFLEAARGGDFDRLIQVLAPEAVLRSDVGPAGSGRVEGAEAIARQAMNFAGLGWRQSWCGSTERSGSLRDGAANLFRLLPSSSGVEG